MQTAEMHHHIHGGDPVESSLFKKLAKTVGSRVLDPLILNRNPINEGSPRRNEWPYHFWIKNLIEAK